MADYRAAEERVLQAVDAFQRGSFTSLRAAARHFEAPYGRVKYRARGGDSRSTRQPTNRLLTKEEEGGLILLYYG